VSRNEEIARAIVWKPCDGTPHYGEYVEQCRMFMGPARNFHARSVPDFSTPDGLAEVKAWVEAETDGAYAIESYTIESSDYGITERWREVTVWLNGRKAKGESTASEAEAFLTAFLEAFGAAHKDSTGA
jgi:hypothetical protein